MASFEELRNEHKITRGSDFADIAQVVLECYYLPPYPGNRDLRQKGGVNRKHHGGVHVCSAALNMEMLIAFYQKHFPELLVFPDIAFDDETITLLKFAALYHDSANTRERFHEEAKHAANFTRDMKVLGFNEKKITAIARAIAEKDTHPNKTIFHALVHDVDCLDIIRIYEGSRFRKDYLEIYKLCRARKKGEAELDQIIQNHDETYHFIQKPKQKSTFFSFWPGGFGEQHINCERSPNCYRALVQLHEKMLNDYIQDECKRRGFERSEKSSQDKHIALAQFGILDLYNRKHSENVKNYIDRIEAYEKSKQELKQQATGYKKHDDKDGVVSSPEKVEKHAEQLIEAIEQATNGEPNEIAVNALASTSSMLMEPSKDSVHKHLQLTHQLTKDPKWRKVASIMLIIAGIILVAISATTIAATFGVGSAPAIAGMVGGVSLVGAGATLFYYDDKKNVSPTAPAMNPSCTSEVTP